MDKQAVLRAWLAKQGKEVPENETITIEASESRVWSEYTSEDFSCTFKWGDDGYHFLGEGEVTEFLN